MTAKLKKLIICIALFGIFIVPYRSFSTELSLSSIPTQVYFSPNGGCTEAIVKILKDAKTTILVQAYSFTSEPIAQALIDAYKRGVAVEIIADKSQESAKYSMISLLYKENIPVFIDRKHVIAHNKVMIIDSEVVITGSFNFTTAAEYKNAENLLIIQSKDLAKEYIKNYNLHRAHSVRYNVKE